MNKNLRDYFLVQKVLVFFHANGALDGHLALVDRQSIVRVVKDDLDKGAEHFWPAALVQQTDSVFFLEHRVLIAQHELNRLEEVGFTAAVAAHLKT